MIHHLQDVQVRALPPERLTPLIGIERAGRFAAAAAAAREVLEGRTVLNVNSTATGGGVAELLQTLLAYARGAGIDTRWVVIEGNPSFFEVTKRIHNHLYGTPGDGGPLAAEQRAVYDDTMQHNLGALAATVRPGDIVLLHDPQTAGLASALKELGVTVVWRCHVGIDEQNEHSMRGWEFLRPYLERVDGFVFSCERFAPAFVPRDRLTVIAPSIDPFSAKNEPMSARDVMQTLQYVGLLGGEAAPPARMFTRRDGSPGRVRAHTGILVTGPPPPPDVPVVMQASRWDPVKDMAGVMHAFCDAIDGMGDAHLVLAGPSVHSVTDDPEAEEVLADCTERWHALPDHARARVHLACIPMDDADEAAAIVNALQRHSTVVTQKSLAEGFGLTVAEAMWKARPVVGTAVGGIIDQIVPNETGSLVDAHDLDAFAAAIADLLADPARADRLGTQAQTRATDLFLGDRHLEQWAEMFGDLLTPKLG